MKTGIPMIDLMHDCDNVCPQRKLLEAEIGRLREQLDEMRDRATRAEHVISEEAMSVSAWMCRCDDCKQVAQAIADAGYLETDTERWWDE